MNVDGSKDFSGGPPIHIGKYERGHFWAGYEKAGIGNSPLRQIWVAWICGRQRDETRKYNKGCLCSKTSPTPKFWALRKAASQD